MRVSQPAKRRMRSIRLMVSRLLRGLVRPRAAPGIVFFLGLGDALECLVIGLLIDLRLLLLGLFVIAVRAPRLGVGGRGRPSQHHRRCRQRFHWKLPVVSAGNLLRNSTMAKETLLEAGLTISNY